MENTKFTKRDTKEYTWVKALVQYMIIYLGLTPLFKLIYKTKIIGAENIPKSESFIVAASHSSYLDPVIVSMSVKRPIAFMAKKELFNIPFLREIIVFLGAFAVDREKVEVSTIKTAKNIIFTKKWIMAMFPQGGRDIPGTITRAHPGFAHMAKMTKAKILPVSIYGSHEYHFLPFSGNLTVRIGEAIEPSKNIDQTVDQWKETIAKMLDEKHGKEDLVRIDQPLAS